MTGDATLFQRAPDMVERHSARTGPLEGLSAAILSALRDRQLGPKRGRRAVGKGWTSLD